VSATALIETSDNPPFALGSPQRARLPLLRNTRGDE
jgi:hypothetical protein